MKLYRLYTTSESAMEDGAFIRMTVIFSLGSGYVTLRLFPLPLVQKLVSIAMI